MSPLNLGKGDFVNKFLLGVLAGCGMLMLAGCAMSPGEKEVQGPMTPLSCIAVPPAGNRVDNDQTIAYDEAKKLEKGAAFASSILVRELADNPKVRIISQSQMATIMSGVTGGLHGSVALLGEKVNCDGVLLTTVRKFEQREGTDLAVDAPASADLNLVLYHAPTKKVLWTAEYRETQESFLSNILSFDKMQNRGFKWVTVEQMVDEGLSEKLKQCPYFK